MKRFDLSRRAFDDLQDIWKFISKDNSDAADRVIDDLYRAMVQLADMPGMGHKREDLTSRAVLFWPVHSYLVVYTNSTPAQIVRVVHGKRDLKQLLK